MGALRQLLLRPQLWAGTSAAWLGIAALATEPWLLVVSAASGAAAGVLGPYQDYRRQQADFDYRDMLDAYQDRLDAIAEQTDADVAANLVRTRARHAKQHADFDAKMRAAAGLPLEQPAPGSIVVPKDFVLVRLENGTTQAKYSGTKTPNEARRQLQPYRREYVDDDGDVTVVRGFADAAPTQLQQELSWQQSNFDHVKRTAAQAVVADVLEQLREHQEQQAAAREQAALDYVRMVVERGPVGGIVPGAAARPALEIRRRRREQLD